MKQILDYRELKAELLKSKDKKYREFSMKICPSKRQIIGVRVPIIKKIVNFVPKEKIENFLEEKPGFYEEVLARGFLIARMPYEQMLKWFDSQVKYIDDWSTCDLFCSVIGKNVRKNKADFYEKTVIKLLNDKREFHARVGLVILKCCYVELDNLEMIFKHVESLGRREEYYVKMAIAWLISECFIKFPTATTSYLVSSNLPAWTFNKAISKTCDSFRVDKETKKLLKNMRKKEA